MAAAPAPNAMHEDDPGAPIAPAPIIPIAPAPALMTINEQIAYILGDDLRAAPVNHMVTLKAPPKPWVAGDDVWERKAQHSVVTTETDNILALLSLMYNGWDPSKVERTRPAIRAKHNKYHKQQVADGNPAFAAYQGWELNPDIEQQLMRLADAPVRHFFDAVLKQVGVHKRNVDAYEQLVKAGNPHPTEANIKEQMGRIRVREQERYADECFNRVTAIEAEKQRLAILKLQAAAAAAAAAGGAGGVHAGAGGVAPAPIVGGIVGPIVGAPIPLAAPAVHAGAGGAPVPAPAVHVGAPPRIVLSTATATSAIAALTSVTDMNVDTKIVIVCDTDTIIATACIDNGFPYVTSYDNILPIIGDNLAALHQHPTDVIVAHPREEEWSAAVHALTVLGIPAIVSTTSAQFAMYIGLAPSTGPVHLFMLNHNRARGINPHTGEIVDLGPFGWLSINCGFERALGDENQLCMTMLMPAPEGEADEDVPAEGEMEEVL